MQIVCADKDHAEQTINSESGNISRNDDRALLLTVFVVSVSVAVMLTIGSSLCFGIIVATINTQCD